MKEAEELQRDLAEMNFGGRLKEFHNEGENLLKLVKVMHDYHQDPNGLLLAKARNSIQECEKAIDDWNGLKLDLKKVNLT